MWPSPARTCQRSTYAPLVKPRPVADKTSGAGCAGGSIFTMVPSGFSKVRVERAPSTRELYLRLMVMTGPLTEAFFCGVELKSTACASALRGLATMVTTNKITAPANHCGDLLRMITFSQG